MTKKIDIGKDGDAFKIDEDGTIIRADENNILHPKSRLGWIIGGVTATILVVVGILLLNWYNEDYIPSQTIKEQTIKIVELTGKDRAFWISYHMIVAGENCDASFHLFEDCPALKAYVTHSDVGRSISYGRVEDALKDKGYIATLCVQCEDRVQNKRNNIDTAITEYKEEKKESLKIKEQKPPVNIKQKQQAQDYEAKINEQPMQDHKIIVPDDKPEIFNHVEVMPTFPGGDEEMRRWLAENIKYPVIAQEQGIQGRVIVRFVVSPDGSVGAAEVQRSLDPNCDREALRVIKRMPKWIPGKQNGNAVYVYYTIPIAFRLSN
jgi:TonB family protein